jgi:hypothetical protein
MHSNFVARAHQLEAEAAVSTMEVFYTESRLSENVGRDPASKFPWLLHNLLVDVELLTILWLVVELSRRLVNVR